MTETYPQACERVLRAHRKALVFGAEEVCAGAGCGWRGANHDAHVSRLLAEEAARIALEQKQKEPQPTDLYAEALKPVVGLWNRAVDHVVAALRGGGEERG